MRPEVVDLRPEASASVRKRPSQLQWGKRIEACHSSRPCAGIVALSVSDVVLLRRRSVFEGSVFSLPRQWGFAIQGWSF